MCLGVFERFAQASGAGEVELDETGKIAPDSDSDGGRPKGNFPPTPILRCTFVPAMALGHDPWR